MMTDWTPSGAMDELEASVEGLRGAIDDLHAAVATFRHAKLLTPKRSGKKGCAASPLNFKRRRAK